MRSPRASSPCVAALAMFFASLFPSGHAEAQDESYRFEVAPYLGYRLGGTFDEQDGDRHFDLQDSDAQGLMFSGRVQPNTQWEVLYGRQSTEVDTEGLFVDDPLLNLDVDYIHFGGTYLFEGNNVRPFIALTVGVTHVDPAPSDFSSENFFSFSFGGGWQLNATKRLGVRLEARAFVTSVNSDSRIFCESGAVGGACVIDIEAESLTQWEARAGLVFLNELLEQGERLEPDDIQSLLFSQRHFGADNLAGGGLVQALQYATAPVQVTIDVAHVIVGRDNLHLHDGLQQHRLGFAGAILEGHGTGNLESHFVGINVMIGAVVEGNLDVNDRVAGNHAILHLLLNAFVD